MACRHPADPCARNARIPARSCGSPMPMGTGSPGFSPTPRRRGCGPARWPGVAPRQHARVEDRIRQAKATGLANLPFNSFDANAAWLEIIMAVAGLADQLTEVGVQRVTIT
jgi:hypothetical protein